MDLITEESNPLPVIINNKCSGCLQVAKDTEVLHCHICNNHYHVANCTVVECLPAESLPSKTNITNYSKFSKLSYSTGSFTWTCFRCKSINELSSKTNLEQRVSILESLLITFSPALKALSIQPDNSQAAKLISELHQQSSDRQMNSCPDHSVNPIPDSPPTTTITTPLSETSDLTGTPQLPSTSTAGKDSTADGVSSTSSNINRTPTTKNSKVSNPSLKHRKPKSGADTESTPKTSKSKYRIKLTAKSEEDPPLRALLHQGHNEGKIGSYSMRFHSSHKADLNFNSFDEANTAFQDLSALLSDYEISKPYCSNSKLIHIAGLTSFDTKESVYSAIAKPGKNHAIQHLVNPSTVRVLSIKSCKRNTNNFKAVVSVSMDIYKIIFEQMKGKIKIDYLSCYVFVQPDSIRCNNCQDLGHSDETCTKDPVCVICGGDHSAKDCPDKSKPKCINCFKAGLDSNHRADYFDCPSYKNFRRGPAKK